MVLHVTNSPFYQEQVELLNRLLPTLSEYQRIWLSGYLTTLTLQGVSTAAEPEPPALTASIASVESAAPDAQAAAIAEAAPAAVLAAEPSNIQAESMATASLVKEATVLFGSQTGNSQRLAKQLAQKLKEQGFQVTLSAMSDFKTNNLKKVQNLFIISSTHGEGEPPDNAVTFHEFLHSSRAPQLPDTNFAVLALGDTSYEFFCKTGKDFDKRLEELGAKRLVPRVDCDVDFEEPAAAWIKQVIGAAGTLSAAPAAAGGSTAAQGASPAAPAASPAAAYAAEPTYSRSHPFQAEILQNLNLNGRGSNKETRHIEISLKGSDLMYEPGDSLGIYPENHPRLVDELIYAMGWNEKETVPGRKNDERVSLRDALLRHYEITVLTQSLIEQTAGLTGSSKLQKLVQAGNEQELKSYIQGRDLLDLVRDFELRGVPAAQIVPLLRKLPARLYSISSSQKATPDEVHITVGAVRYRAHGRTRFGVSSVYLAERAVPGKKLPVFVQHNPNFKLPQNPDTPIIMIGPGTGVAPFRAFMAEREETGAAGKSWLFFGDQHYRTDFLYQTEWQRWLKDGVLTRMDVAFSRDTDPKVYVQHRMAEQSRELYAWLEEGAIVYVCGDKKNMAHDVHAALIGIIQQEGGMSSEKAAEYLDRLKRDKRYQRDVY